MLRPLALEQKTRESVPSQRDTRSRQPTLEKTRRSVPKADAAMLRRFAPLERLTRRSLNHLTEKMRLYRLSADDRLFNIGDTQALSYFLVRGTVQLEGPSGERITIEAGSERARYALSNLLPRQYAAKVSSPSAMLALVDKEILEKEILWGRLPGPDDSETSVSNQDWQLDLLHTSAFSRLSLDQTRKLFGAIEQISCEAGETVVAEGEPGDYYYIIRSGNCKVVRQVNGREIRIGQLGPSESFGDEALVSDHPRNASVIMESAGRLLRLAKTDFQQLMQTPLVKRIAPDAANEAIEQGRARLIDVRTEEEFTRNPLPNALNIPLFLLYLRTKALNRHVKYVVHCGESRLGEAAAFLLIRKGFDTYLMEPSGNGANA